MDAPLRWTPTRKQRVVCDVLAGRDIAEVAEANAVTVHELKRWRELYSACGLRGLYVTKRAA